MHVCVKIFAVTAKFNKLDFLIQRFFRDQHTVQSLIYGKYMPMCTSNTQQHA